MTQPKAALTPTDFSERQLRACHEFLKDGLQIPAFRRAGYAEKTATKEAYKFFAREDVKAYITPLLESLHAKTLASAQDVLAELSGIATANLADFYKRVKRGKKDFWVLKELDELTEKQQRCIMEFKPGEYIKLHSKDSSLDKLAKHFKLYTDLEAGLANFNLMPVLRISGKEVIFEVGRPAPQAHTQKN